MLYVIELGQLLALLYICVVLTAAAKDIISVCNAYDKMVQRMHTTSDKLEKVVLHFQKATQALRELR